MRNFYSHTLLFLVAAGASTLSFSQIEATLIITNSGFGMFPNCDAASGIHLTGYPSGTRTVYNQTVHTAKFSPDGKRIAFTDGSDALHIMDNDGANVQPTGTTNVGSSSLAPAAFQWTTNGIFWFADDKVHRYMPETGDHQTILDATTIATPNSQQVRDTYCADEYICCGHDYSSSCAYWSSRDGRKVWLYNSFHTDIPGFSACAEGGRGAKPYLIFSPDFQSYHVAGWGVDWGHGAGMTIDGHMAFVRMGSHRTLNPVVWFSEDTPPTVAYGECGIFGTICKQTGGIDLKGPAIDPPIPDGLEAGFNFPRCANNDSMLCAAASDGKNYLYNWKTSPPTLIGTFESCGMSQEFWYGPLPDPRDGTPYITLGEQQLSFVLAPGQTTASRQLTVTNLSSGGQMQKVSASVAPAGISWLATTVEGSGGNTQTITVTVTASELPGDISNATIAVSGGGASNAEECAVVVYKGEAVAAPTGLSAQPSGDSLLDVSLAWTDNATNETGYVVERQPDGGSWEDVARTAADAISFTDLHLDYGDYLYRVRAIRDLGGGVVQQSDNSNESTVTVQGKEWIRVTNPLAGAYVKAGDLLTIRWSANLIYQVRVFLSLDMGRTFEDIHIGGGITVTSPEWGNFSYRMPDTENTQAVIKVEKYEGGVSGTSGAFNISQTLVGAPLPEGYMKQLLQLEKSSGGQGAEMLSLADATAIETRYVGASSPAPADGEEFTANATSHTWHIRDDADGMWADGDADNFVSYWSITVLSPEQRSVRLAVRHDDDLTVWKNATVLHSFIGWDNGGEQTSDMLSLAAGENRLLFKLQEEAGGNHFAVRILDEAGNDATGLFYVLGRDPVSNRPQGTDQVHKASDPVIVARYGKSLGISIRSAQRFDLRIYGVSGRLVGVAKGVGPEVVLMNGRGSKAGIYVLRGSVGESSITETIVIPTR